MRIIRHVWMNYKEYILYLFFGAVTTLVNWVAYALFETIGLGINVSNVLAGVVSVLTAYFTNKKYVFNSTNDTAAKDFKEFIRFSLSRIITGIVEIGGLPVLVYIGLDQEIFHVKGMVAKIVIGIIVIVLNYIASKWVVFTKDEKQQDGEQ